MSRKKDEAMDTAKLIIRLLDNGFDVAIRKTKRAIIVECHKWSEDGHESAHGRGTTIDNALTDAWNNLTDVLA